MEENKEIISEEIKEEKTEEKKEKKGLVGNVKAALSKMVTGLIKVFKDYPLTMGAIVITTILGAILIDYDSESDLLAKIAMFFGVFLSHQSRLP